MASILMNILETSFNFVVPVENLIGYESYKFVVGQVPWHFLIKEQNENDGELQIILVCKYNEKLEKNFKWSIEAEATVKLKSFNDDVPSIVRILPLTKFQNGFLTSELIKITLLNGQIDEINSDNFISDGHFNFEATVRSKPVRIEKSETMTFSKTQFGFVIKNIKDLAIKNTPIFSLQDVEWYVQFKTSKEHLGIYLCHVGFKDFAWSINAKFSVKLLPINDKDKPIVSKLCRRFYHDTRGFGWLKFITWKDLTDENKTYIDDNTTFEISVEAEPAQPLWEYSQGALNIDGQSTPKCPICFEQFIDQEVQSTACGHLFCGDCIKAAIEKNGKCSLCNKDASVNDLRITYLNS